MRSVTQTVSKSVAWLVVLVGSLFVQAALAQTEPAAAKSQADKPLRLGVVGLVHGHVEGLLWAATQRNDIEIVGVYEPNKALFDKLATKYGLPQDEYFASLEAMLDAAKPEAVSVMTSIKDHLLAVEACAPRGVHMLVEKPLAFDAGEAKAMEALATKHNIHLLTNFETSWYASVREAKRLVDDKQFSPIRKMVFRHGHKGPKELGCTQEFLDWLTDPEQNGGGAVVDFGCYGAVLSTWLMQGERPTSIAASATTLKPAIYPHVDDDATIVLTYPSATATIQASWAWTHDNKEMELHTEQGSLHAAKWNTLQMRRPDQPPQAAHVPAKESSMQDEWTYLRCVVQGTCKVDPLSSLEYNVIVAEILDEARKQIAEAKRKEQERAPKTN
jgi:predicted dehydrogenase